jgi:hypothetical protein
MDEYIKREDALDAVLFALVGTGLQSCAIHAIRDVPTADVAPKSEVERLEKEIKALLAFKDYFSDLYGHDLEIANWHENGDIYTNYDETAEKMVAKGYRKQSEPISCGHEKGSEWVQLPCKIGDTLYVISQTKDKRILPFVNQYEVTSIAIKKKSIVVYHEMDGYIKIFKQADFGKTVFLTREEAEAKMKGGE